MHRCWACNGALPTPPRSAAPGRVPPPTPPSHLLGLGASPRAPPQSTAPGSPADTDKREKKKKSKKTDGGGALAPLGGGATGAGGGAVAPGAIAELGVPLPVEAQSWCARVADAVEKADLVSTTLEDRPKFAIPMWRPV